MSNMGEIAISDLKQFSIKKKCTKDPGGFKPVICGLKARYSIH